MRSRTGRHNVDIEDVAAALREARSKGTSLKELEGLLEERTARQDLKDEKGLRGLVR